MIFTGKICVFILISIVCVHSRGDIQFPVIQQPLLKIIPGVFFETARNVPYESYIPLLYDIELKFPSRLTANLSSVAEVGCNLRKPSNAKVMSENTIHATNYVCSLEKLAKELIFEIESHLDSVNFTNTFGDLSGKIISGRSPRSLSSLLGDTLAFCCDVVTKSDIMTLVSNEKMVQNYLNKIKTAVKSDHSNLIQISQKVVEFGSRVSGVVSQVKRNFDYLEEKMLGMRSDISKLTAETYWYIINSLESISETIDVFKMTHVVESCRARHIPWQIIKPDMLHSDLEQLKEKLQKEGYKLAIPDTELEKYFELNTVECGISGQNLMISIKIPITSRDWSLIRLLPIPFAYGGYTCNVIDEPILIATYETEIRVISPLDAVACHNTELCRVPKYGYHAKYTSQCIMDLLNGTEIKNVKEHCMHSCVPHTEVIITDIGEDSFVITNSPLPLKSKCPGKDEQYHDFNPAYGAIELHIECGCRIELGDGSILTSHFPCNPGKAFKPPHHIIPAKIVEPHLDSLLVHFKAIERQPLLESNQLSNLINDQLQINFKINETGQDFFLESPPHLFSFSHTYFSISMFIWNLALTLIIIGLIYFRKYLYRPNGKIERRGAVKEESFCLKRHATIDKLNGIIEENSESEQEEETNVELKEIPSNI